MPIFPSATRTPSPKPLLENPYFIPIDQERQKRLSNDSLPPNFENSPRVPSFPRSTQPPSTYQTESNTSGQEIDLCEEAEDFLQFLSKAGFMAADRRASSVRRGSAVSANLPVDSRQGSLAGNRRTSITAAGPNINSSRPSSLILDSRRTSLAHRRGSSGVVPPILRDDPTLTNSDEAAGNPRALTFMEREDRLSEMVSQMRISSSVSLASASLAPPASEEDSLFLARKKSSFDFTDLETLLARARNPILTQMHRSYTAQFEMMSQQIANMTLQVEELKQAQAEDMRSDREISLDVYSLAPSDYIGRSRSVSQISSQWRTATIETHPVDPPFWREQLQRAGEEWDQGGLVGVRRGSLRCISPMTKY